MAAYAPRWIHWAAVFTVVVTIPLLVIGAEVTTKKFGMADERGFRAPWYLLNVFMEERGLDWKVEHGHRAMGFLVGTCIILLNVALWWKEPRSWVRILGFVALVGVSAQGILGIFRIEYHAPFGRQFALIHGCFAHLVLAVLMTLAAVTGKSWRTSAELTGPRIRDDGQYRFALLTCFVVYVQLVLGAVVRHMDFGWASRSHVIVAAIVAALVAVLAKTAWDQRAQTGLSLRTVCVLVVLVGFQLLLGMEAWISKFFVQTTWNQLQPILSQPMYGELIRSIHYLVGSLIFSTTVIITLNARRLLGWKHANAATAAETSWQGA